MGLFSDIRLGIKNLINDDPNQYVADEDKLDNELVIAMSKSGNERISIEEATLLSKTAKEADKKAVELDEAQKNSIILHASDMVIRARNGIEKWFKVRKANKKLIEKLNENIMKKDDLPKDHTVTKAEATNGKIQTVAANELQNQPREQGGRERDQRTK